MTDLGRESVVIVNTGCANISSVRFAIERLGAHVSVTSDHQIIEQADKVLLPGVGSAHAAMANIQEKDLVSLIQSLTQPVLGICLGMQLMASFSEEGNQPCLDLIKADVKRMQAKGLRLPHMGWNTIKAETDHPLLKNIADNSYFYFVHSFAVEVGSHTMASCNYGSAFSAAIFHDNFMGVQFHPERSSENGAKLLQNFLDL